jgi:hypothetical protein
MPTQSQSKSKPTATRKARASSGKSNGSTPITLDETFEAPKSRSRSGPKLTPEQLAKVRKEAGRKAAAARRATRYIVTIDGEEREVNGAQLAGLRAARNRKASGRREKATA